MYPALLFKKLPGQKVNCQLCQRRCVIASGKTGFCLTRQNIKGKLFSLTYGILTGFQIDPIEKKPLYHFHPGTQVLSIGSYGCNFRCRQCLNWSHSWGEPATSRLKDLAKGSKEKIIPPEKVVEVAKKGKYPGIAFTYNEPLIWLEYVLDCAKLAKKAGLFTVFVTNGSWTKESLTFLAKVIDAANVDVKGATAKSYQKQGAFFGKVLENLVLAKKLGIFLELTTLVIPGINDSSKELEKIAKWMVKNLGKKTPWHLSRFSPELAPDREFQKISSTPKKTLEKAYQIGKKAGLEFVYIWAPPSSFGEGFFAIGDTVCPKCGAKVVARSGWQPEIKRITKDGKCKKCGEDLNVIL